MEKLKIAFDKVSKTILSCNTPQQLEAAYRMLHNFFVLYSKKVGKDTYTIEGDALDAFEALNDTYKDKKHTFQND
jgi:hypothetical protein